MNDELQTELVEIQPHGCKPPLLFFPSLAGETSYAHGIARHMGSDQPVWGVQPTGSMIEGQTNRTMEEMARRYVDDLCILQPEGAFRLAGYSFSGVLAYETACQLVERGRQVKLVAVIDTGVSQERPPSLAGVFGISLSIVRNLPNWVVDNIVRSEPNGFVAGLSNHLKKLARRTTCTAAAGSAACKPEDLFDVSRMAPEYVKMMESNLRAFHEYTPKHYSGRVTLFRARTRPLLHSQSADLGWGERVSGGVEILSIPGHHASILKEPGVEVLAKNLQSAADNSN